MPLSRLQATDFLQGDTGFLLVALSFVRLVFEHQQGQTVWKKKKKKTVLNIE